MKNLKQLVKEKYSDLVDLCKEADYEAYSNSFGSGWTFDVVLDSDGTAEVVGPRNNSVSEREWNGLAKVIYSAENLGDWGYCGDYDTYAIAWIKDDDDVIAWMKEHEVTEDDDYIWDWRDDDGVIHYFDSLLPDEMERRALREYVNSDYNLDQIYGVLDYIKDARDEED